MNFKDLPLGKKTNYPRNYDPSLLVALDRKEARNRVGIKLNSSSFYGLDSWTAYELSWLNSHGLPENGILYDSYSSSSKNFIESKSFKLYLNSLNNKKIKKKNDLYELLKKDLGRCVSEEVEIEIVNTPRSFGFDCISIDSLSLVSIENKEEESKENKAFLIKCGLIGLGAVTIIAGGVLFVVTKGKSKTVIVKGVQTIGRAVKL